MTAAQIIALIMAAEQAALPVIQLILASLETGAVAEAKVPAITPQAKAVLQTYLASRDANTALLKAHMAKELGINA